MGKGEIKRIYEHIDPRSPNSLNKKKKKRNEEGVTRPSLEVYLQS
jgi:hypothetical protein